MNFRKSTALGLVTALALGAGVAGTAFADSGNNSGDQAEKQAIASASISLKEAMTIAEKKLGGTVEGSGIENQDGKAFFWYIEVRGADGKLNKVLVDMKTGKIAKAMADDGEHENGENGEDHDGNENSEG